MQLDDVHSGHGETSTVDHAADVAVQGDVVQLELGGLDFLRVLLRPVTQREQIFLTELGVVVEPALTVQREVWK